MHFSGSNKTAHIWIPQPPPQPPPYPRQPSGQAEGYTRLFKARKWKCISRQMNNEQICATPSPLSLMIFLRGWLGRLSYAAEKDFERFSVRDEILSTTAPVHYSSADKSSARSKVVPSDRTWQYTAYWYPRGCYSAIAYTISAWLGTLLRQKRLQLCLFIFVAVTTELYYHAGYLWKRMQSD